MTNNILPVVRSLKNLVIQAHDPANKDKVPDGFRTARVRRSLDDLRDQLGELIRLTEQVEQQVPLAEDKLAISGIAVTSGPDKDDQRQLVFFALRKRIRSGDRSVRALVCRGRGQARSGLLYPRERELTRLFLCPAITVGHWTVATMSWYLTPTANPQPCLAHSIGTAVHSLRHRKYASPVVNGAVAPSPAFRAAAKSRSVVIETGTGEAAPTAPAAPAAVAAAPAPAAPAQPAVTQDQIAALQNQIDELKASHESGIQKLADKMTELFGGKNKDKEKKSKDDD